MLNEYKFCPLCTDPLETKTIGGAERRQCTGKECEFVFWNNPTPVLAAITHRRDEVILIQAIGWPKHWYSLVTGFHESGETAEEIKASWKKDLIEFKKTRIKYLLY